MKTFIAILLLAIVTFAAAQPDVFTITNLETGDTQEADGGEIFATTRLEGGFVTVTINASFPVEVCFQENIVALGSLMATCNQEGFISGPPPADGSDSVAEVNQLSQDGSAKRRLLRRAMEAENAYSATATLYLRDNTQYGVSARWTMSDATEPQNQTGNVLITVTWSTCPAGNTGYGPNCEIYATPVDISVPITGSVSPTNSSLLSFEVTGFINSIVLSLQYNSLTAATPRFARRDISASPVQIYVRRDAYPVTTSSGSILSDNATSDTTSAITNTTALTFVGPEQGLWLILISPMGNASYTYTLTVQTDSCPANQYPLDDGNCTTAVTIAPNVQQTNTTIPANGTLFLYPTPAGGVQYFTYLTSQLLVGVAGASHGTQGAPGLYVSTTSIPSAKSYEVASAEEAQVNFVNVATINDQAALFIIAVAPLENSDASGFEIWAGQPCAQNCSGNGVCGAEDGATGICTCNSGYKDFACSTQKLKTIYIVLIAIGAAIVIAIAIGVPVGCYIKNRKRARYERV